MSELMDAYWRTPPVARNIATAVFVSSVAFYMGLIPTSWMPFYYPLLFRWPPQIWRLVTSFLISSPQLGILLDPYFVYTYLQQLETGPRLSNRQDLVWYLMFVSSFIVIVDSALGWFSGFYLRGLILSLVYTGTQDLRGVKASFYFITIPAQLTPYAMILVSLLMGGPDYIKLQVCGLVGAHLYDFLTRLWPEFGGGSNLLPTPSFLSRLVPAQPTVQTTSFGTAFRPAAGSGSSARTTGADRGSGPLPDAWRTRGRGQRLGGD